MNIYAKMNKAAKEQLEITMNFTIEKYYIKIKMKR